MNIQPNSLGRFKPINKHMILSFLIIELMILTLKAFIDMWCNTIFNKAYLIQLFIQN